MTHPFWQRFQAAGEHLATAEPAFFPSVVTMLERLAEDDELAALLARTFVVPPAPQSLWTAWSLAELLCRAEPRLSELEDSLDNAIVLLPAKDRECIANWALQTIASASADAGDLRHGDAPTIPGPVAVLLAMLIDPSEDEL